MIPADIAFAQLVNKTTAAYVSNAPTYMTYNEYTHISVSGGVMHLTNDINRSIAVRVADDYAVMRDLPNGGERTGQAWPIVAYFDPLSLFGFGYLFNLTQRDIMLTRGAPFTFTIPTPDPTVDIQTPYMSFWVPQYAPDSTDSAMHFLFHQTPVKNDYYPTSIVVDPSTGLPSHIDFAATEANIRLGLDYQVLDGHWVITHGTFASLRTVGVPFRAAATIEFKDIAFPATPPDPRLATSPSPGPTTPGTTAAPSPVAPAAAASP